MSDTQALEPIVTRLLEANPEEAEAYRKGKKGLMGFFVGQVMKETGGAADPGLTRKLLEDALGDAATE